MSGSLRVCINIAKYRQNTIRIIDRIYAVVLIAVNACLTFCLVLLEKKDFAELICVYGFWTFI